MVDLSSIIFLLFFLSFLAPMVAQAHALDAALPRDPQARAARGSRVITLIHRQESISLLGIPLRRFIDVEDSEQVLRAIRLTPDTCRSTSSCTRRAASCSRPSRSPARCTSTPRR